MAAEAEHVHPLAEQPVRPRLATICLVAPLGRFGVPDAPKLTLMDDTKIAITPPGTGWTAQIAVDFSVVAGQSTVVNLNLRMDSSFKVLNGAFEFEPEIELEGVEHD